jgi:hypothetical protein
MFRGTAPKDFDEGDLGNNPWDEGDLGGSSPEPEVVYEFDEGDDAGMSSWFDLEVVRRTKRALEATPPSIMQDRSHFYEIRPAARTIDDYDISAIRVRGLRPIAWESNFPEVATVKDGEVRGVSAGNVTITASDGLLQRSITLPIAIDIASPTPVFAGFVEGSLAAAAAEAVLPNLEGKSPSDSLRIFTTQNPGAGVYVRNPDCWAAGYDLTCLSPAYREPGGSWSPKFSVTPLTPQHVLIARHTASHFPVGTMVGFVTQDGAFVVRTIVRVQHLTPFSGYLPDLTIGLLDDALPSTITPAKVLPENWRTYVPILEAIPLLALDQEEKALVMHWAATSNNDDYQAARRPSEASQERPWSEAIVGGDSGNPVGLLLPDGFCLITVWTFASQTQGLGTDLASRRSQLDALIASIDAAHGISTGYTLTTSNLSSFNAYE